MIKPADKGGGIVILEKTDYIKSGQDTCTKLQRDLSASFSEDLQTLVNKASMDGILNKK